MDPGTAERKGAGPGRSAPNHPHMPLRARLGIGEKDLERLLLRRGVGELEAGRCRCADCGRTPLIGEDVHRYGRGVTVCELCRPLRAEPPERSHRLRGEEAGQTVRVKARLAA